MKFTKETAKRMFRTFFQAVIACIVANLTLIDFSSGKDVVKSAILSLCGSAVAAGIAAVMNLQNPETTEES